MSLAGPVRENKLIILAVIAVILFSLTLINLWSATVFGESCGVLHPVLFAVNSNYVDEENNSANESRASLPSVPAPTEDVEDLANDWESCLQYWGYVDAGRFNMNEDGIERFLGDEYDTGDPNLRSTVVLSNTGTIFLYLFLPSLVLLMPLATLAAIRKDKTLLWIVMGGLVAAQALSSALLYIHLSQVSGIQVLADFGTSIFGGTTTGTAIAFMGKMLDIFKEN